MKLRTGFVSNSSSSSYVIRLRTDSGLCSFRTFLEFWIQHRQDQHRYSDDTNITKACDDIESYKELLEEYVEDKDGERVKEMENILAAIETDPDTVYQIRISYGDYTMHDLLTLANSLGEIEILQGWS